MLATMAGAASAAIGFILGRTIHLAIPIPMFGSLLAALPRTAILLVVLVRINRFGTLVTAGFAEVIVKMALGLGGTLPLAMITPIMAGLAGEAAWFGLSPLKIKNMRLLLTGGALSGSRILVSLLLLFLLRVPANMMWNKGALFIGIIIAINVVLGIVAGLIAVGLTGELKRAGVME